MEILKKFVLGDSPVRFDVVSPQNVNFPDTKCVNYEDPNFNICMPVFSIHGNHDDPAGAGGFSAVDLLSSSRLLNYFGKAKDIDNIKVTPVLMEKGDTRLALFGVGNVRDDRMARAFRQNKVTFERPEEEKGLENSPWFSMCVLHQNRVMRGAEKKNCVTEKMIPPFFDLVVWGHEHECRIEPERSENDYHIIQPGSSVATSLSAGEAIDKHFGVLEIRGDLHRLVRVPFRSVRTFLMEDVSLRTLGDFKDQQGNFISLDPDIDRDDTEKISAVLARKVQEMERSAIAKMHERKNETGEGGPKEPLLRLRVDHTGFAKINVSRFGQQFVGRVANPEDLLLFTKEKQKAVRKSRDGEQVNEQLDNKEDMQSKDGERAEIHVFLSSKVDELLRAQPNGDLSLLPLSGLADAIQNFVEKKESDAIQMFLTHQLEHVRQALENLEYSNDIEIEVKKIRDKDSQAEAAPSYAPVGDNGNNSHQSRANIANSLSRPVNIFNNVPPRTIKPDLKKDLKMLGLSDDDGSDTTIDHRNDRKRPRTETAVPEDAVERSDDDVILLSSEDEVQSTVSSRGPVTKRPRVGPLSQSSGRKTVATGKAKAARKPKKAAAPKKPR
jgi:double-strand break repair protein MRE11